MSAVARTLRAAALGEVDWRLALGEIAAATGYETAQLLAVLEEGDLALVLSGPDTASRAPDGAADAREPRIRVAFGAHELTVLTEQDLQAATGDTLRKRRGRRSAPAKHILQSTLIREGPLCLALSLLRGEQQGSASREERRVLSILAPHVRNAVRTRIHLERHAANLLTAAMDYAGTPAFVLGRDGRCLAMTSQGRAILNEGDCLRLVAGRLQTARPEEAPELARAIGQVTRGGVLTDGGPLLVRASALSSGPPTLIEICPAPPLAHGASLALGAVVVLRQQMMVDDRVAELARTLFGLTAAEARVAALMVGGGSVASIARARGVGFETARTHVRSILAKSGVRRQAEFVAKMCRYR